MKNIFLSGKQYKNLDELRRLVEEEIQRQDEKKMKKIAEDNLRKFIEKRIEAKSSS